VATTTAQELLHLKKAKNLKIAIPGPMTSAALALKLFLKDQNIIAELVPAHFDKILDLVKAGTVDAGVIIHEGQITHAREGFVMLQDLGAWWWQKTNLPLPLGINVVRKSLGSSAHLAIGTVLKQSILYAMKYRKEALDYALTYGRGLSFEDADTFVAMYVNDYTIELGEIGKKAIERFLSEGFNAGFIKNAPKLDFVDLSSVKAYE
jgi:1,4-dihydroxy-6-naphthoate synthase